MPAAKSMSVDACGGAHFFVVSFWKFLMRIWRFLSRTAKRCRAKTARPHEEWAEAAAEEAADGEAKPEEAAGEAAEEAAPKASAK